MIRKMLLLGLVGALTAGCDYTVPLVKVPELAIDTAVVGRWQKTENGKAEDLLILPLGEREYLVVYPADSKDAMFARGCIWKGAGLTLVQLNWFGTANGNVPDDNRTFQYASYVVEKDSLSVRLLSPDVVAKDIGSSEALAKAIAGGKDAPGLFRNVMVFTKTKE